MKIEGLLGSLGEDGNYYEIRFRDCGDHCCIVVLKEENRYLGWWEWVTELCTTDAGFRDFFLYRSDLSKKFRRHPKVQKILKDPVTQLLMEVFDLQI